jgi:hypothetical protein
MKATFKLKAKLWLYPGKTASWHFVTLPAKVSADIKKRFGAKARGWGSLPVQVTIGKTAWKTSVFPDAARGAYILPIKAAVRKKERMLVGEELRFTVEVKA